MFILKILWLSTLPFLLRKALFIGYNQCKKNQIFKKKMYSKHLRFIYRLLFITLIWALNGRFEFHLSYAPRSMLSLLLILILYIISIMYPFSGILLLVLNLWACKNWSVFKDEVSWLYDWKPAIWMTKLQNTGLQATQ